MRSTCGVRNAIVGAMGQRLRSLGIIWFALLLSVGMFAVALIFARSSPNAPTDFAHSAVASTYLVGLGAFACVAALASLLVPRLLLKRGLAGSGGSSDSLASGFGDSGSISLEDLAAFQASFIAGMALSESVAMFGFVLGYLGFGLGAIAPFFGVSALLMLARFPSRHRITRALRKARSGGSSSSSYSSY